MASLNAKDFLRTLVFGHFTHHIYHQIKFTFDRFVATAAARDFVITTPEEFNGDIEIDLDTLKGAE